MERATRHPPMCDVCGARRWSAITIGRFTDLFQCFQCWLTAHGYAHD